MRRNTRMLVKMHYFSRKMLGRGYFCVLFLLLSTTMIWSQNGTQSIKGQVTDESGNPLIGVSIRTDDSKTGTMSDVNGQFSISTLQSKTILTFNYIGYALLKMEAVPGREVKAVMKENTKQIDEVVVVGYGTQRKKDLTGSISVVNTDNMKKIESPNIGQALQGQVSGVNITTSGEPGSGADIQIRGIGSFSSVGPLYVIDGMIIDGSQREFNVNDIESVQILKDAAASALYGARGANGVIIITTKKGTNGVPKIDFTSSFGVTQIAKRIDMMNSLQFLRLNRQAYENANMDWPGEPQQGQVLTNTDWQDEFFKTGYTQDYNLTASGGSPNANYLMSANYYNEDGTTIGTSYKRMNLRSNTEIKKGIFTMGENVLLGNSKTDPLYGAPFIDLCRMPPIIPVYNEDGSYGTGSSSYQTYGTNPIGNQNIHQTTQTSYRIIGNGYIQLEPVKGLKLKTNLGVEYHNWFDREITDFKQVRYLEQSSYNNFLLERKGDFLTWMSENTLTYEKHLGDHSFDVLLGYSAQDTKQKNHVASVYNFTDGFPVLSAGNTEASVNGTDGEYSMTSILARVNYNYAGKYLFQANYRRDGSSRFGANYRYGNFPSVSAGWRISEENFFKPLRSAVNDLKIRASYGTIGDQQAVGYYDYATYIVSGEGAIFGSSQTYYDGAIQKGRANPNLHWESKTTLNAGFDFSMIDNHLFGTIEYYNAKSTDLLVQKPISWTEGTDIVPWTNYGSMRNQGLEINIGWREQKNAFKWSVSANISLNKNKVLALGDSYVEAGLSNVNRTEVGRSVGDFYVLQTDGIFQSWDEVYAHTTTLSDGTVKLVQPDAKPGDIRYKDINQDGKIDKGDRAYEGSPLPKIQTGINFSAEYKNFDFNLFIYGVAGNTVYNNVKFWLERMSETSNAPANLQPWTEQNHSTTTPRAVIGTTDNAIAYSDRWLESGSYLRLKNVQIGYTFPKKWMKSTHFLENSRIYLGAQNLFTITKYSGYDPEISGGSVYAKGNDDGHYPPVRMFTMGLQLSF